MNRAEDNKPMDAQPELDPVSVFAASLQKTYDDRKRRERKKKGSLHFV